MSVASYRKFKILIHPDSRKVQGLRTGDIVRRQYFDGTNVIYSLMCVVDYGVERTQNPATGLYEDRAYFVGALLEGDAPDPENKQEILDFARITSLCDTNRSGALYLTASDDQSPFMDVIDGIGRNKSLSWPENLSAEAFEDAKSQYIVKHHNNLHQLYTPWAEGQSRILTLTRQGIKTAGFEGLQQDFYEYVANPNQVLVSYWARASRNVQVPVSLGYVNGTNVDGQWTESFTTQWEYKFKVVTVDFSGRHLRTLKLSAENLQEGQEMQISDFNIILLSSVANFGDASASRFGRLDGVADTVFGRLSGYGAYMQRLYASKTAHISGTLTAGDENGFGATFYAGKIHRNSFRNSIDVNFLSSVTLDWHLNEQQEKVQNFSIINPTGIGHVYFCGDSSIKMVAQDNEWLVSHVGKRYCFSFWIYAKKPCSQIGIKQNGRVVGTVQITSEQTYVWKREHVCFDVLGPARQGDSMMFELVPVFVDSIYTSVEGEENADQTAYFFTAPQLESGENVTQYQPTDSELNYTDTYGAWFSEGGIGGTIQNPLIQLNKGGSGAIESRGSGFKLNTDGSGHLAKNNIRWDTQGKVTFGRDVTLNWDNLGDDAKDEMANRFMRIVGEDTFGAIEQDGSEMPLYSPATILLSLEEIGFSSTSSQRQWYVRTSNGFMPIPNANGLSYEVDPNLEYWNGEKSLTFKCIVTLSQTRVYADTITIKKQQLVGYTVKVVSSKGTTFQNGTCQTMLTAQVYYQGQLVDVEYARSHFIFTWSRYDANDLTTPLEFDDYDEDPNSPETILLNYELGGNDVFVCEISVDDSFDYSFPVFF